MTLQSGSTESYTTRTRCLSCGSAAIRPVDGWIVCTECGTCHDREMVQGTYVIREGEYEGSSQFTDIGNKIHIANSQGSLIGHRQKRQSIFNINKVLRLKRTHHRSVMLVEARLTRGLIFINKAAVQLQLPTQTRDRAAYLLRKTLPHFQPAQTPLVVVVLVLAIREHQLPITEKEVLNVIPTRSKHKHELNRAKFFVMEQLGIKWPTPRPEWFIPKVICAIRKNPVVLERLKRRKRTLDYFNMLERLSSKLLKSMTFVDYGGRFADILAASAIYSIDRLSLNIISQKHFAEAVGTAEFSIRDHHNQLWKPKFPLIKELLEVED